MAQGFTGNPTSESGGIPDLSRTSSVGGSSTAELAGRVQGQNNDVLLKAIGSGIKFADEQVTEEAKKQAVAGAESIQADTREAYFASRMKEAVAAMPEKTPQEIADKQREMSRLTDAYDSGALTSTHYWSRMDAMARTLRSRFPGYREEIDQTIAKFTGGRPQNEVIGDILAEVKRQQSSDPNKEWNHLWDKGASMGVPEIAAADMRGEKLSIPEMRAYISRFSAVKADIDNKKSAIGLDQQRLNFRQDVDKDARENTERAVGNVLNQEASTITANFLTPLGLDRPEWQSVMNGTTKPSEVMLSKLSMDVNKLKLSVDSEVEKMFSRKDFNGKGVYELGIDSNKIEAIKKNVKENLQNALNMYGSGDFALLKSLDVYNKLAQQGTDARINDRTEYFRTISYLKDKGVTPADLSSLVGVNSKWRTDYEKGLDVALGNKIIMGTNTQKTLGQAYDDMNAKGASIGYRAEVLDKTIEGLKTKSLPAEDRQKFYNFLFGDTGGENGLMMKLRTDQRRDVWAKMTSTDGLNAIKELDSKIPGTLDKFRRWTEQNGTVLISQHVDNLNALNAENGPYKIGFNRVEGMFKAVPNPSYKSTRTDVATTPGGTTFGLPSNVPTPREEALRRRFEIEAREATQTLAVLKPTFSLVKPDKMDTNTYMFNFISKANFNTLDPAGEKAN